MLVKENVVLRRRGLVPPHSEVQTVVEQTLWQYNLCHPEFVGKCLTIEIVLRK
jgi:hypothetical protein